MSDYLYDRSGEDAEVAELEGMLGVYAHREPLQELRLPSRKRRVILAMAAITAAAAALLLVILLRESPVAPCSTAGNGMTFSTTQGTARCGGRAASSGTLAVGTWLETTQDSVARVQVAAIGDVTVYGNSRLRVVGTSAQEHRLELAAGRIAARVSAPPRLFVVDTPAATAVDLGCAYELSVDDAGVTHLVVTSGAVSLEGEAGVAYAPAGIEVAALPGRKLTTPIATATSAEVRAAVARFDANRTDRAAVDDILANASAVDIITLWHLITRVPTDARAAVVDKLSEYVPVPFDYEPTDVIGGSSEALDAWREEVEWEWLIR